jgi:hypothetical protein
LFAQVNFMCRIPSKEINFEGHDTGISIMYKIQNKNNWTMRNVFEFMMFEL